MVFLVSVLFNKLMVFVEFVYIDLDLALGALWGLVRLVQAKESFYIHLVKHK